MNGVDIPSNVKGKCKATLRYRPSEASDQEIDQRACNFNTGDSRGHGAGTTSMERGCQRQGTPKQGIISCKMSLAEVIEHLVEHGCPNVSDRLDLQLCGQLPMSSGGFGDVYQGTLRNGAQVALKCLRCYVDKSEVNQNALKHAAKELYAWSKCKHSNVVQLLGLAEFRGQITMVSPWMENGSVGRLDKSVGVDYRCTLVHGDLKGANVLLSDDGVAQLTDFGNATPGSRTLSFTGSAIDSGLSIRWASPEQLKGKVICSKQADVYSLGMTILEVISGEVPFANVEREYAVVVVVLVNKETPARPEAVLALEDGNTLWALLTRCWAWNPGERPVASAVSEEMNRVAPSGACDTGSIREAKQAWSCSLPRSPAPSYLEAAAAGAMTYQETVELTREYSSDYMASRSEEVSYIINGISTHGPSNECADQLSYLEVVQPQTSRVTMILESSYKLLNTSYAATIAYFVSLIKTTTTSHKSRHYSPPDPWLESWIHISNESLSPCLDSFDMERRPNNLPLELRQQIFVYLIQSVVGEVRYMRSPREHWEESYQWIKTISKSFPECNEIFDRVWTTEVPFWAKGDYRSVRALTIDEESLPLGIHLSPFRHMQTISFNLHSSFTYNKNSNSFRPLSCVTELPPSLERLEIMFFHGSDSEIIEPAARCCPNLAELRLVHCTMFNKPKCRWWRGHRAPTGHTYMQNHNVTDATDYAVAIASLLRKLVNLAKLHLGDYHTNFDAIMIHRMNHQKYYPVRDRPSDFDPTVHSRLHLNAIRAGGSDDGPLVNDNVPLLAPLDLWSADCPECRRMFASETEAAERRAAAVLATRVWSLRTISFASFFSDRCVGPSSWEIRRRGEDASGKLLSPEATQELGSGDAVSGQLRVETFRANNRRTIRKEMFERREVGWSVVD